MLKGIVLVLWLSAFMPLALAQACSRGWLVFFTEGSVAISERAERILQEFVRYSRDRRPLTEPEQSGGCGPLPPGNWRFVIEAHAQDPRSGDQCDLSHRRGLAVRARLVAHGLPEEQFLIMAWGERRLMTPALPETSEPVNRWVGLYFVPAEDIDRVRRHPDLCPG